MLNTEFIQGINAVVKFFIPPVCIVCQESVDQKGGLCSICWNQMTFLSTPRCNQCAEPFFESTICLECHQDSPFYDKTRSLFVYNNAIRPLVLSLKYQSAEYVGFILGRLMGHMINNECQGYDYIVPVPLHWCRFLKRGYNQAVLLSKGLQEICKIPSHMGLLYRHLKENATQAGASAKNRQKNVHKAFAVHDKNVKGKKIILVDDVMTTGATVNACSKVLKEQGVKEIMVVTLAKSLKK